MCGIFGYTGYRHDAIKIVLEGLKQLEYRGYDSWGIGVETKGKIIVDKHIGKIGDAKINLPNSNFAFGHTRWATHGGVTDVNAHPHLDCTGRIAVVHNGIIENYQEISKLLADKHNIVSQTDTELAAHLIEDYRKRYSFTEAVRQTFLKFRGLSAFLAIEADTQTIIAIKNGSPLVLGKGTGENLVGSDANCLLQFTKHLIFLEDSQLAQLTKNKISIFAVKTGKKIKAKIVKITWKETASSRGQFPHFMLKEIFEQPKVLENILHNFAERLSEFASILKRSSKIYLVGCGTAYYATIAASYILSKIAQQEVISVAGSEFVYKEPFLNKQTLVVFLSQSGETIDIIEPLKKTKEKGIKTIALINVFGSSLYRLADYKIWLEAGPEICVISTKAFIAKLGVLGLTAYTMINKQESGRQLLKNSIDQLSRILEKDYQAEYLDSIVKLLAKQEHIYTIGRGLSYPIALETALKIKEASYIHVEGFAGGELKHGPIALTEKATPYLVFNPNDETYETTLSNATEIKARGGLIIGISENPNEIFDFHIPIANCGIFTMVPQVALAQLLAYKLAVEKGCDPDKPRNLAKSVTVR